MKKGKTEKQQRRIPWNWPLDDDSGIWNNRKNRHQTQPKQNKMQETKK